MSLKEYARKRDFRRTGEPPADAGGEPSTGQRFVIQKHDASRLHYDFRLEMDGALKSWAVPKGIPLKKGEKRLAVQVEDHPLAYADFEGTIPKGEYGAGTVMIWDTGTYELSPKGPKKSLESGQLHFILHGKKLEGEWGLVRMKGEENQWLLIKHGADERPITQKMDNTSAISGKGMNEISKSDRVWHSNPAAERVPLPAFIEPMKAKPTEKVPTGDWVYELKFDGYRAIALKGGSEVSLMSRVGKPLRFPDIAEGVAQLNAREAVIDGEIVALDSEGRSSFQLLQAHETGEERPPIFYYAFDLLRLDGTDLQAQPLIKRKAALEQLLQDAPEQIRFSASLGSNAKRLLEEVKSFGLEGLIGKLRKSPYESGRRSGAWLKLKLASAQEFVVGGYTPPEGSRKHFGAVLVGYFKGKELWFAGRAGSGFTEKMLTTLFAKFQELRTDTCPFSNLPEDRNARYGQSLTAAEMKRCHWVRPELVCQVRFSEWTRDGKLRQPVFLGLRSDRAAEDVVREPKA
jgi:bifunctional non-homologous end joining protein LigD